MISAAQLAQTDYKRCAAPSKTIKTSYGYFTSDLRFKTRYDATHHFATNVKKEDETQFFASIEQLYKDTNLKHRMIKGHDPETLERLRPFAESNNWTINLILMMVFKNKPARPINPKVKLKVVNTSASEDLKRLIFRPEAYDFAMLQNPRLGGETILAYLDNEAVGSTGWFIVNGIARYRSVFVSPDYRKQHVASTMLQYVQNHPTVKAQTALTIHVDEDGPVSLYETLGFVKHSILWELKKKL